ncbi:MAG: hypothetical protein RMJ19_07070 [Gemmatales bacterium]|nr:hypothetical protein [Gemmatales bacterium]MCS7160215.1 hypothetical protein [Gemmatales bacterium]MDW8175415.1 hypothetical protein [Gemmatales bacterium]MDW8222086.1 hypothetical protein [Gemmatales bacterium]
MRRLPLMLLLGLFLAVKCPSASAQVLIGTVRSVNEVIDTTKYVATLAGRDDIAQQIEPFLDTLTGGKGLAGLDRKAPFGFYVDALPLPGQNPPAVIFVPITREDDFVELLRALNSQVEKPDPQGIRTVTLATGQTAYLSFAHGHAFLSLERNLLTRRLPHPKQLVPQPHSSWLYLSLRAREIPPAARKGVVALLQLALAKPLERKPDESEASFQVRRLVTELARNQMLQLVQDLEELTITADLDRPNHQLNLAVEIVVRPDSASESALRSLVQSPSRFRALPDRTGSSLVLALPIRGPLQDARNELIASLEKSIAEKPGDQQKLLRQLYEAILPTLRADTLDLAVLLHGPAKDGKLTPLVAIRLQEGSKLESTLRDLYQVLPEEAKSRIRLDAHKLDGYAIHEVQITPDDQNFALIFGEEKLAFTLTNDCFLFSAGTHASNLLKEASGKTVREQPGPALNLELSIRQLALLGTNNDDGKRFLQAVQRTFVGQDEHRDRIRITQQGQANRVSVRLELPVLLFRVLILANQ